MKQPLISVVVLGYKQFDITTGPCLESLKSWLDDPDIEFIVVDNCSPDDSAGKTAAWCAQYPRIKLVLNDQNAGYAGGMNLGASYAKGDWLFLVNNDTLFPDGAMDALKKVLRNASHTVAMIGPITNAAGNGQRIYQPDKSLRDWLQLGDWVHRNPTHLLIPTYRCDFFCIAIRREVWESLNGLDTAFGLGYYEDFDFSLRAQRAGWEQKITEDVFVVHAGSATFQASQQARALLKKNKKLLKGKHPSVRFEHVRQGNLKVLEEYSRNFVNRAVSDADITRMQWRLDALEKDGPKSFFKKIFWHFLKRKIKSAMNKLLVLS